MKQELPIKLINIHAEIRSLIAGQWVTADKVLTLKSHQLLDELALAFQKQKKAAPVITDEFRDNMQKYVEIFPKLKLPSGKQARVHVSNLEAGFKWFFEKYGYDWETVLRATQNYVSEFEKVRFEHMRTSQYFIRKQNLDKSWISDLADYCSIVNDNSSGVEETSFDEKVN